MFIHTLYEIVKATDGSLLWGDPNRYVRGVFTDTRAPLPGGLFLALTGPRFDGNAFATSALRGGAAAVLVSRADAIQAGDLRAGQGAVLVSDTRAAYLRLAEMHRAEHDDVLWCAVSGSAGKSTVKDMLAHVLSATTGWKVHRAEKSFNNEVGVPATMLGVDGSHQAAVLEIGMNHAGEIAPLADAARPNLAIITNAGPVHLEALGSVEAVAEEKSHLLDRQNGGDIAVLNADDAFLDFWTMKARGMVITFGLSERAGVRGLEIEQRPGQGARFYLSIAGEAAEVQLQVPGRHNVINALAAAAAAWGAGLSFAEITVGLESFMGTGRRFQVIDAGGVSVIDDAYNANPLSFRAALETLKDFAGRRWFVVAGDMLELGAGAEEFHRELGRNFAAAAPHALLTVGPLSALAGETAVAGGLPGSDWTPCATPEEAAERLKPRLMPGDVVLVKGSNAMQLGRCVERLTQAASA